MRKREKTKNVRAIVLIERERERKKEREYHTHTHTHTRTRTHTHSTPAIDAVQEIALRRGKAERGRGRAAGERRRTCARNLVKILIQLEGPRATGAGVAACACEEQFWWASHCVDVCVRVFVGLSMLFALTATERAV